MLILTRKPGESLYIGDDIKITIVEIKGHQIRVGIDAPKEYRIYREEIYLAILEENRQAAEGGSAEMESLEGLTGALKRTDKPSRLGGVKAGVSLESLKSGTRSAVKGKDPGVVVKRKRDKESDE